MGPCPFGDLASVSPDGPLDPGDLQARPFRAEKLTEARQFASGTTTHYIGDYYYAVALGDTHQEILGAWATGVTSAQYVKLRVLAQDSKIIIEQKGVQPPSVREGSSALGTY